MTQIPIDQTLALAIKHHQAARLAEAETLYRQILARQGNHPDALNLMGILARQAGNLPASIDFARRAVAVQPRISGFHCNLGTALAASGRLDEAAASLRRAVELDPTNAEAWNTLGHLFFRRGQIDEAIEACEKYIALKPNHAPSYSNLSFVLKMKGRFDEAIAAARRAIVLQPDLADAHNHLGIALVERGDFAQAVTGFREAVRLKPDFAEAHSNLSPALRGNGRLDDAILAARRAIDLKPDLADAHNNLGLALWDKRQIDPAIEAFGRAVEVKPDYAEAYNNLGSILAESGRLDAAVAAYLQALRWKPNQAAIHRNLGGAYKQLGRLDEAIKCWRQAIALNPRDFAAHSNLVFSLHYHPDYDAPAILAEYKKWSQCHEQPLAGQIRPHKTDRTIGRRLKIGYVSPDFRDHPAGRILLPLLAHHDHDRFEITCYSDVHHEDVVTRRLRGYADQWRSMVGIGDAAMAERIRGDRINVLVDTTMHMADHRLLVFARKPAPVQVTWLGYPGTTGLSSIDYRLTDPVLDPPGEGDDLYTERSIRLPHCFWCYEPLPDAPEVNLLPALSTGHLTFGCFNNFAKVSRAALQLWINVMQSLPGSRMILRCPPGSPRDAAGNLFASAGIAHDRLEFVNRMASLDYLRSYQRVDLCLDPIPYPGHTCTLDSLWMGVPPITLSGRTVASRGGASILSNVGLFDYIARSPEEYISIAGRCAENLPALADLRLALRKKMQASPLLDGKQFAADFESAYLQMWAALCR